MMSVRRAANLPLPRWAYVPGETNEAGADYETLAQAKPLVPSRFRDFIPARHPALRYGIALNDNGYFWESQEILEAVWAAAAQGGRERILPAGLHPDRPCQSSLADAQALCGCTAVRGSVGRVRCARCPQGGRRRRRICRWFSDRRACGAAEGQIGVAGAVQGRLG